MKNNIIQKKKAILAASFLVLFCCIAQTKADGERYTLNEGAFRYAVLSEGTTSQPGTVSIGKKWKATLPSGTLVIPSSIVLDGITYNVTRIGEEGFANCKELVEVTIPDSVTVINDEAFENCKQLQSAVMSKNVTRIGNEAFSNCRKLSEFTIPDSTTTLGDEAFENCVNLKNLKIGNALSKIGEDAFDRCSSLEELTLPASLTHIGECAFKSCKKLSAIYFSGNAPRFEVDYDDRAHTFYDCSRNLVLYYPAKATGWSRIPEQVIPATQKQTWEPAGK